MHIILKDPATGEQEGLLCVERSTKTCFILAAEIERLEELVSIAKAQKVPTVMLVVPIGAVKELQDLGWEPSEDMELLVRNA